MGPVRSCGDVAVLARARPPARANGCSESRADARQLDETFGRLTVEDSAHVILQRIEYVCSAHVSVYAGRIRSLVLQDLGTLSEDFHRPSIESLLAHVRIASGNRCSFTYKNTTQNRMIFGLSIACFDSQ